MSPPFPTVTWSSLAFQTELPFYKKHPKYTSAALGIAGTVLLAPVAIVGVLGAVGFTAGGVAAGNLVVYLFEEIRR